MHPDRKIGLLAGRQHGRVGRRQLLDAGLTDRQIGNRVRSGHLVRVHAGVYAVGFVGPGLLGACAGAVLAYAPGCAISHVSAAALHGLRASAAAAVHVTVARHGHSVRAGIRLHRSSDLRAGDVTHVDGVPATSVARTFVDCAAVLRPEGLARMWREAHHLRVLDVTAIDAELRRARPGTTAMRALLADGEVVPVLRSELESLAWALLRRHRLGAPLANVWLPDVAGGIEVDLLFERQRLVVELDGWRSHGTFVAFHADRTRDAWLQVAGFRVVRLTWRHIVRETEATVKMLWALLSS